MNDDGFPIAVKSSSFRLFGVEVHCHVLDNGQRIIEEESLCQLLEAMGRETIDAGDQLNNFAAWLDGIHAARAAEENHG